MQSFFVYNPWTVETYLETFSGGHERLEKLLKRLLTKPLLKEASAISEVKELPADATDRMRERWGSGDIWHVFDATGNKELDAKITRVAAWLKSELDADAKWLSDTVLEKGSNIVTPKKLVGVGSTLDQVITMVDKAETKSRSKHMSQVFAGKAINPNLEEAFMVLGNGYYIKHLRTPEDLDEDSEALVHCLGSGKYDEKVTSGESLFYSLRGPNGAPHVTIEVDSQTGVIIECQGKELSVPRPQYLPMIIEFMQSQNFRLDPAFPQATGIMVQGDKYLSMYELPDGVRHDGDLDFSRIKGARIPKDTAITGNLILNGLTTKEMPEGITVGKDVFFLSRDNESKHHNVNGSAIIKVDPRTKKVIKTVDYEHGAQHGDEKTFDRVTGNLVEHAHYNRDNRTSYVRYDETGAEAERYTYIDGRPKAVAQTHALRN